MVCLSYWQVIHFDGLLMYRPRAHSSREVLGPETEVELGMAV